MNNADFCVARNRHCHIRKVYRVGDVAVFDVVNNFLNRHNRAVVLAFGRGRAKVGQADNVFVTDKVVASEVGDIASHSAVVKSRDNVCFNNKSVTGEVQQANALFHQRNRLRVYHTLCVRRCGNVESNIIALFVDFFYVFYVIYFARKFQSVFNVEIGVIAVNFHSETCRRVGNQNADCAQTDNAELLAHNFGTYKLALAFFNELAYFVALAFERFNPLH